ncbi:hypothetical protein [Bacillus pumilus]|uniref:hypothetical protein n=1 Tax=Bacillus pumilus TaxID=1408 RepID=UPI0011A56A7B|nr:hypothetical protein [Bacillus pumilus]
MKLENVKMLDMTGGEITKISYEGAEFERVEGDVKVGDLLLLRLAFEDTTAGAFYNIVNLDRDSIAYVYDDRSRLIGLHQVDYVPFGKKHTRLRLKVGDYAKVVVREEGEKVVKGDFVKVTVMFGGSKFANRLFYCEVQTGESAGETVWARESELVFATEAEVAKEAEANRIEKLKWGNIGRKADEFREGDIVKIQGSEKLCEVIVVDYSTLYVRRDSGSTGFECKKLSTLVCPVEARFDQN